ncbi:putative 4-hydroxy-2-oxovalerate aldolase [Gordonia terrae NBRC 100016]|uniref:4-hydroxy-2-oxovalerate aldolase n=1 Tax=Gordonia terrae NBRC 100016 TaxID=1089454 RepID=A0ABQ0HKC8_9ACTN|nr:putative 4-hydroxy-2-oxovalerate aldolase [Gordonia terrae NBRC 100016]
MNSIAREKDRRFRPNDYDDRTQHLFPLSGERRHPLDAAVTQWMETMLSDRERFGRFMTAGREAIKNSAVSDAPPTGRNARLPGPRPG